MKKLYLIEPNIQFLYAGKKPCDIMEWLQNQCHEGELEDCSITEIKTSSELAGWEMSYPVYNDNNEEDYILEHAIEDLLLDLPDIKKRLNKMGYDVVPICDE
jgi:hypothetical protein